MGLDGLKDCINPVHVGVDYFWVTSLKLIEKGSEAVAVGVDYKK